MNVKKHYAKRKKTDTKEDILCDSIGRHFYKGKTTVTECIQQFPGTKG